MTSRNPAGKPRKIAGQQAPANEPVETPEADGGDQGPGVSTSSTGGGRRRTWMLVVAIVVLLGLAVAEVVYLTRDDVATVSSSRPVVTGDLTHRAAVDTAAKSTVEILSTSYDDYDEQVEQATSKMTDTFAEEYRETADGIRDRFVDQQTKLQFEAVGQSVVQASPEQVKALLFLNQYVEKVVDGQPRTDYAQYRALVTVVHTDHGWLVSDIETK
jgi:Mce-associated membrane protein